MGNKLFAAPWNALAQDEDEKEFILDIDKTRLENASGFDKDNWPDMADETWGAKINSFYRTEPYEEDLEERKERTFRGGGGL